MDKDCKSANFLNESNENQIEEVNLPEVVAGLKMLAVDKPEQEEVSPSNPRRSLRRRIPRQIQESDAMKLNRRCNLRPMKRTFSEMENEEQIKEYYLDKTVKKYTNSLETIFEERDDSSQTTNCMSVKRFRRMIQFTQEPTDSKIKKRKDKIKKVFGSKINYRKRRNVSMQALLDKLNGLQNEVSINNESK